MIEQLLEKAKGNRKALCFLKSAAVAIQDFEMAASLREIERTEFFTPETEQAVKEARECQWLLKMVDISCSEREAWTLFAAIRQYLANGAQFSLQEAETLRQNRAKYFVEE